MDSLYYSHWNQSESILPLSPYFLVLSVLASALVYNEFSATSSVASYYFLTDRFGWVQSLHARYVVVKDRDGVETLIPNENLITSEVTNWSYTDRAVRTRIPVQISYNDDPEFAMSLLIEATNEKPRILKKPEPAARLIGFGDNGIDLELRIWINDPEEGVASVASDVNVSIWKSFKENNISIPFPQRDVRIVSENDD